MKAVESDLKLDGYRISDVAYKQYSLDADKPIHYSVSFSPKIDFTNSQEPQKKAIVGLTLKIEGRQQEKKVIELSIVCESSFSTSALEDKVFSKLVMQNGTATLITILRAFITSFTSQTGKNSPTIIMPLINVEASLKESNANKNSTKSD